MFVGPMGGKQFSDANAYVSYSSVSFFFAACREGGIEMDSVDMEDDDELIQFN